MTRQNTNIAAIIMLMVSLMAGSAMAQKNGGGNVASPGFFTGVESAPGTLDSRGATRYGNSFVLSSFGEWESLHLTVSMDYSMDSVIADGLMVTGGTWSLIVTRENQYAGTLYGEVQTGEIELVSDRSGALISKNVRINLKANGGLGSFGGKASENIVGVYNMTTDLKSGATTGNANFTF